MSIIIALSGLFSTVFCQVLPFTKERILGSRISVPAKVCFWFISCWLTTFCWPIFAICARGLRACSFFIQGELVFSGPNEGREKYLICGYQERREKAENKLREVNNFILLMRRKRWRIQSGKLHFEESVIQFLYTALSSYVIIAQYKQIPERFHTYRYPSILLHIVQKMEFPGVYCIKRL